MSQLSQQQSSYPYNAKFTPQDIQILKQLLLAGEKHKWKQITKEINYQAAGRRGEVYHPSNDDSPNSTPSASNSGSAGAGSGNSINAQNVKNVSPTFVIKQYQSLLGLPNNTLHFGILGSSLPYVVASNGWDDLQNTELFNESNQVE